MIEGIYFYDFFFGSCPKDTVGIHTKPALKQRIKRNKILQSMHTEYRGLVRNQYIRISTSKMASAKRTGNEVAMKGKQTQAGGRWCGPPPWDRRVTGDEMRALTTGGGGGARRRLLSTHLEWIPAECGCFQSNHPPSITPFYFK